MSRAKTSGHSTDIAILGSGFAGTLLALLLDKIGLKCIVIDKTRHPRFAIGESSTPIGNMILRELSETYGLPRIKPLATYGAWRETHPELVNGRKRGFSYFHHDPGKPFIPTAGHANELLVAASADDYACDTHWMRSDIDSFLVQEAKNAGIPVWEDTWVQQLCTENAHREIGRPRKKWRIKALKDGRDVEVEAAFLIDATGPAGVVAQYLNLQDASGMLQTRSHALFSHFEDVPMWRDIYASHAIDTADHPYHCDDAAVHQCIDRGWMWMLRFVDGRLSAGFALDCHRYRINYSVSPDLSWRALLAQYPTLQRMFERARLADVPGKLYRTGRLQRLWGQAAGNNWALLPHTAGFIDPLHSTGIAHSLSGVERLVKIFASSWDSDDLGSRLADYSKRIIRELKFTDLLVAGCYPCFGQFDLLTSYTMLYFAAAITYEERRMAAYKAGAPFHHDFLCVDETPLVEIVQQAYARLKKLTAGKSSTEEVFAFRDALKSAIEPYNTAGLFNPRINNMYAYTAVTF